MIRFHMARICKKFLLESLNGWETIKQFILSNFDHKNVISNFRILSLK